MARVNVTIPDDTIEAARALGLNVSAIAADALARELRRHEKVARQRAELDALDDEMGPVDPGVAAEEADWVAGLAVDPARHGAA